MSVQTVKTHATSGKRRKREKKKKMTIYGMMSLPDASTGRGEIKVREAVRKAMVTG